MKGLKASAINPSRQAMISALDGVPVSLSIVDWYQGLSRGVIDAALVSYSAVPPLRLAEVTSHFVEVPMGGNAARTAESGWRAGLMRTLAGWMAACVDACSQWRMGDVSELRGP